MRHLRHTAGCDGRVLHDHGPRALGKQNHRTDDATARGFDQIETQGECSTWAFAGCFRQRTLYRGFALNENTDSRNRRTSVFFLRDADLEMKRPVDCKYKTVHVEFAVEVYADEETEPFLPYCVRLSSADNCFVGINPCTTRYTTIEN